MHLHDRHVVVDEGVDFAVDVQMLDDVMDEMRGSGVSRWWDVALLVE